ncbi:MAG: METTL5 family protein [Thermoplasmata archaeon]|nr:METTL5 family protein [Thermoplasmata archaeon]
MRKRHLEILLSGLENLEEPDVALEQYSTPPGIAAEILYIAYTLGDIVGKNVIDLGCGCGIFAIGAAILGAKKSAGIDADPRAVEKAMENAAKLGVEPEFFCSDVEDVTGSYDTVLQNPPFGCQSKHADLPFVKKAAEIGKVIYSLHRAETERFIEQEFLRRNCRITHKEKYAFPIKRTYKFHRKNELKFEVVMLRAERLK